MPDPNENADALAEAVRRGLEMAMSPGGQIENLITNIIDYQASTGEERGGGRYPQDSESMLERAKAAYRQRPMPHSAADGPSPSASVASANAAEAAAASQARQSLQAGSSPYYRVPPGFGDIEGNTTLQNIAQAVANRNLERIINARSDAEMLNAERGFRRAAYFSDRVLPTYEIGKKIYQQGVQPAYRAVQGLTDVGATQITGPVGGEVGPMRVPFFNRGFMQGAEIKAHQIFRAAITAGLNQEQMREIDSTVMGMGFQFDDKRFARGEKALENLVRFNPTFDYKQYAPLLDQTIRFGTKQSVDDLVESLKNLDTVAKQSGVSANELAANTVQFYMTATQGGATVSDAASSMKYLMQAFPGISNPNKILNTLENNPIAAQQVMARGYMPYAASIMGNKGQEAAFDAALDASFKQTYGKSIYDQFSQEEIKSGRFKKGIADLIKLYGFEGFTAEELTSSVTKGRERQMARSFREKYFQVYSDTGEVVRDEDEAPILKNIKDWGGVGGYQFTDRASVDAVLRTAGIRGKDAEEWIDKNLARDRRWSDRYGFSPEARRALDKVIADRARGEQESTPGDSYNKLVKAMEDATKAARDLQNKSKDEDGNDKDK